MKKNIFFILYFLIRGVSLFSQNNDSIKDFWLDYKVKIDKTDINSKLLFIENSTGKEVAQFLLSDIIIINKNVKINGENLYVVADHSGGESGGFYNINLFYKKNKIMKTSINELSGYLDFKIEDINGNGEKEIIIDSDRCYGINIELKDKKSGIQFQLTPEMYIGIIGPYKEIYSYINGKIKRLTFDKQYFSYISELFLYTESELKRFKGKLLEINNLGNDSKTILEIIQYFYYMAKIGKKDIALKNIKDSKISFFIQIDEKKEFLDLGQTIEGNIRKILTEKNK